MKGLKGHLLKVEYGLNTETKLYSASDFPQRKFKIP
jgi:hypothetical protein